MPTARRSANDGLSLPTETHLNYTIRQPIGPVGVITPWNTPFMLSTWKIAPALAAGCTVVHKPAEWSPLTAQLLAEICLDAGLPAGVLNVVHGFGEDAGKALTEHPDIKAIGFVGESATGSAIMRQGAATLKRVHFELGGKNPVIVFADADIDRALDACLFMIYSLNGERCTSSSRALVEASIYDEFAKRAAERVKKIKVGHPLDPATEIGPLIHPRHVEKVLSYVDVAREAGATVAVGGGRADGGKGKATGNFVEPTLYTHARNDMQIAQEEIFGPVLTMIPFADETGSGRARQRRALRPRRLSLDQRCRPRASHGAGAGGRHDLGEFGECPPPADAVRRREVVRHRPRRRRLFVRLLHGDEEHRDRARQSQDSEDWSVRSHVPDAAQLRSDAMQSRDPTSARTAWVPVQRRTATRCVAPGTRGRTKANAYPQTELHAALQHRARQPCRVRRARSRMPRAPSMSIASAI